MSFLRRLLAPAVVRLANRFSSRPDKKRVDAALSELYASIHKGEDKKGLVIPLKPDAAKFIILSDQHKGARDGADVFALAEKNYLTALAHYHHEHFFYINLGDSEELWENLFMTVKKHNKATFEAEKKFLNRNAFIKIFGNHDLYWDNDPLAGKGLKEIYGKRSRSTRASFLKPGTWTFSSPTVIRAICKVMATGSANGSCRMSGGRLRAGCASTRIRRPTTTN